MVCVRACVRACVRISVCVCVCVCVCSEMHYVFTRILHLFSPYEKYNCSLLILSSLSPFSQPQWWQAQSQKTHQIGCVPINYIEVRSIRNSTDVLAVYSHSLYLAPSPLPPSFSFISVLIRLHPRLSLEEGDLLPWARLWFQDPPAVSYLLFPRTMCVV